MNQRFRLRRKHYLAGFTLVELMLAAALGTALCGALLQLLLRDLRVTSAVAQRMQARRQQQQVLSLIRDERDLGYGVSINPAPSAAWPCSLAGRRAVLAIALSPSDPGARHQAIVYSVGEAPSSIWRGQVLMRCGPAYGLDGRMDLETIAQNRVLLDGLPSGENQGLRAITHPKLPVIDLHLEQHVAVRSSSQDNQAASVRSTATL